MSRLSSRLVRAAIVLHRWLGAVLGVLMLGWCLSGVVMMYVPYPALDESTRLSSLASLTLQDCCRFPDGFDPLQFDGLQIEMLGADAVLRARRPGQRRPDLFDLSSGARIESVSAAQAMSVAEGFGRMRGYAGSPHATGSLTDDQWTVEGSFRSAAPLLTFTWDDPRRPQLYVSGRSGKAVQFTEASQRFWNYLGSIPHWIYFLPLREHPQAWSEVVVYSSLVGSVLTLFGIYLGILQLWRMRGRGRLSPYRGINLWHHVPGVLFGVLVLSWILSGLFSMNPWGFLEDDSPLEEPARLAGTPATGAKVHAALDAIRASPGPTVVSLQSAGLAGRLYFVSSDHDLRRSRLDEHGASAPLRPEELDYIGRRLADGQPVDQPVRLDASDAYYLPHHRYHPVFPVYRIVRQDPERTRYYIDAISGALTRRVSRIDRGYRWLHEGLHRFDFIEARPWWDLLMLLLMSGVTFVCTTGLILGVRRWHRTFTRT